MSGRILVSACLLGMPVRYDGQGKPFAHALMERWREEGRLVALCPEMSAGMPVPRLPAEIEGGASGDDVLDGRARVVDAKGGDVTDAFLEAARNAQQTATAEGCRAALLIDGSPSCGSITIYDGSFSGRRMAGAGVTAALLRRNGIAVFAPDGVAALSAFLEPP
ncbi:DUF523 domain-containing protein [Gellertiella hungarica]|uniref:Uncharacterized protein YbbK (DUF523 family) n=1 Tax=Gellertiella hungarica TaxID=1572859 RepID=A0A7W6J5P2_9HYPH|nr:DUF523 domain-containing protein [Gellertiella hungarica]MBB4064371.1 uncharacterized protein YbbK (DUF523 family) [Gellertiella hungarica]